MDAGIADEIISCEISEPKSLLYPSGASSGIERGPVNVRIRVQGWMTEGLASELPEGMPFLGAEQSHCL